MIDSAAKELLKIVGGYEVGEAIFMLKTRGRLELKLLMFIMKTVSRLRFLCRLVHYGFS